MNPFTISERDLDESCRVISLTGMLDLSVSDRLERAIEAIPADANAIVDLEQCEFIDSIGIGVILSAHRSFVAEGRRLVACAPQDPVRRVLSVIGLLDTGLVFTTLEEALDGTSDGPAGGTDP